MSGCFSPRQVDFGIVIVAVVFVPHTARFEPNICAREKQPPLLRVVPGPAAVAPGAGSEPIGAHCGVVGRIRRSSIGGG